MRLNISLRMECDMLSPTSIDMRLIANRFGRNRSMTPRDGSAELFWMSFRPSLVPILQIIIEMLLLLVELLSIIRKSPQITY